MTTARLLIIDDANYNLKNLETDNSISPLTPGKENLQNNNTTTHKKPQNQKKNTAPTVKQPSNRGIRNANKQTLTSNAQFAINMQIQEAQYAKTVPYMRRPLFSQPVYGIMWRPALPPFRQAALLPVAHHPSVRVLKK